MGEDLMNHFKAMLEDAESENAKLREQLAEAVGLLRDCTNAYVDPADRLRALDVAAEWVFDHDNPDA